MNAIGTQLLRDPINSGLTIDPMAYGGFVNGRRRGTREKFRIVSKNQIQPEYGDEQADAGRDG